MVGCLGISGMCAQVMLDRLEVVASSLRDHGNGWGAHNLRIVRTGAGVLTAYGLGPGPSQGAARGQTLPFRLVQRTESGWKTVLEGIAGVPYSNLLARRDGSLVLIASTNGTGGGGPLRMPVIYAGNPPAASFSVVKFKPPPTWAQIKMNSATISPGGDLDILTSWGQSPGGFHLAHWKGANGKWSFHDIETKFAYQYAFLFPGADGPEWVAVRDVQFKVIGYKVPPGQTPFNAAYDALRLWREKGPKEGTLLREEPQTDDYLLPLCDHTDVYRDQLGRIHILYTFMAKSTGGERISRHMILRTDGTREKDVELPLNGMWRMIQDASGRYYLLFRTEDVTDSRYTALRRMAWNWERQRRSISGETTSTITFFWRRRVRAFRWRMWWTASLTRPKRSGSISGSGCDNRARLAGFAVYRDA